jgi:rubredoxin
VSEGSQTSNAAVTVRQLTELEKDVVLNSFKERGAALAVIKENQLYLPAFSSFDDYCQERWGFERTYGYRLIEAAALARAMLPTGNIKRESHARALLELPEEARETALRAGIARARADGRPLKASDLVIEPPTTTPTAATPKASDKDSKVVPGDAPLQSQLRALWAKADPADRKSFLGWIQAEPEKRVKEEAFHFRCTQCGETYEDDSVAVRRYMCGSCGTEFTADETVSQNNQCPDCNRFAQLASDHGCPECEHGEIEEVEGEVE